MAQTKRFYWLKLKDNFFDEKHIKALRKLPDGDALVIVYLKMQLKSLNTEGLLNYDHIMPSMAEELALMLDEDENIVKLTLSAIVNMGIAEIWDNETLYMSAMQPLIGSESESAERMRRHREQKPSLSDGDVTRRDVLVATCDTEKREEKIIEERAEKSEITASAEPIASLTKREAKHKHGEYSNVSLSDEDLTKLKEEFPGDWQIRIERLSSYMASTGKAYKNHLATIRNWSKRDAEKNPVSPRFKTSDPKYDIDLSDIFGR